MASSAEGLHDFFQALVEPRFEAAGVVDATVSEYVVTLLSEFVDGRNLYRVRNAEGKPLHDLGEMLLESDPVYGAAANFDREREVRKHIGDYALFFTGMFPESINSNRLRRHRLENFVDFVRAGKESYHIVAQFDLYEYEGEAYVFEQLSRAFERCVLGLNQVRADLQAMQHPIARNPEEPRLLM
ncbi:MAG: hypothetical protein NVS9B15_20230 [Acidobacteriaceae bacterium]